MRRGETLKDIPPHLAKYDKEKDKAKFNCYKKKERPHIQFGLFGY